MGVEEHKREAEALGPIRCAVLAVTDTRTEGDEVSGQRMVTLLRQAGHLVITYKVVKNQPEEIAAAVREELEGDTQLILTAGGTGLSQKDLTIEVISPMLQKVLPGFGELFRSLSFQQVGSAAFMSRALLGVAKGKVIVSLPGSPKAAELALQRLILPELKHLIWESGR